METNNLQQQLLRKLMCFSRRHFHCMNLRLDALGLGSGQAPILRELHFSGAMCQKDLAERARVTPATISGTLKRMEKNGFIVRTQDESDARVTRVALSEQGERAYQETEKVFAETDREICKDVSEEECLRMMQLIERMSENVQNILEKEGKE